MCAAPPMTGAAPSTEWGLDGKPGSTEPGLLPKTEYINDGESQQKYKEHEFISTQEHKKFAPHPAPSLTFSE